MSDTSPARPTPAVPSAPNLDGARVRTSARRQAPSAADASSDPTDRTSSPVNVTRLIHEAASKSGVLWIRVPGGGTHPVWFAWHDDGDDRGTGPVAFVVSGPGEQHLPWLPERVEVILRSKDTGNRLLIANATTREVRPDSSAWEAAVEILRPRRLNAVGDVAEAWRQGCVIHAIAPHGRLVEQPGRYADDDGAAPVHPARPATSGWRPWHWRGRARARRATRR
ncbi:MAG: hypothetical protein ACRCYX_11065 [Dermatophilaceae bacterium]